MRIFLIFFIIFIPKSLFADNHLADLGSAVESSINQTISQVKDINLGEAESDLAKGIDDAMDEMTDGMEFALEALNQGDAETALQTMEMLETTMSMAINEIPSEEFMDFSKINFDDFSPAELAAAQSMMGEMMQQNIEEMSQMMEQMSHVENKGFDVGGFMKNMDESGFGFEKMFGENMESMSSMFGEDMSMIKMMDGMEMEDNIIDVFMMDHEGMNFEDMMDHMDDMNEMSKMMDEHMDFENFESMANMMGDDQMEMMTEGMKEMMGEGHFNHFGDNMEMMGNMIKGEQAEGIKEDKKGFFEAGNQDEMNMMMSNHMEHMGESFENMSEEEMASFVEHMGSDEHGGAFMDIGDMQSMGMNMEGFQEHGDMFAGEPGGDMFGGEPGSDMFGPGPGGDMFGGEPGGDMFGGEPPGEMFGEAFGGEGQEGGGMFNEHGFEGGGEKPPGEHNPPPPPPQ